MTAHWQRRKSGVLLPCDSPVEAQQLATQLLTDLLSSIRVVVFEDGGRSYVNQSVTYLTREGAMPYDVSCMSEQTE